MIVKNEPYSPHKLEIDNKNYKKKKLRDIQRSIHNLSLSQEDLRHLFEGNLSLT